MKCIVKKYKNAENRTYPYKVCFASNGSCDSIWQTRAEAEAEVKRMENIRYRVYSCDEECLLASDVRWEGPNYPTAEEISDNTGHFGGIVEDIETGLWDAGAGWAPSDVEAAALLDVPDDDATDTGEWWIVLATGPVGDSEATTTPARAWQSWETKARLAGYSRATMGSAHAACSARIAGPYASKREAEAADISNHR